jgi:polar amino acid transport system substrate-binding protein
MLEAGWPHGRRTIAGRRLKSEMSRGVSACVALLLSFAISAGLAAAPANAQTVPPTLRVETFLAPPLAMEQDGAWTGFSIDLWEQVAARLKTRSEYLAAPGVAEAFEALRTGKADILVSGFFITAERDRAFDFSHSIAESGQQVMVRDTGGSDQPNPLTDLLELLFSRTTLVWLLIAVLLVLIPAHAVWLIERHDKDGIIPSRKYIPGIFHAIHWSAGTLMSQSDRMPHHPLSRIISYAWMFTSVVFIALYTAQLTSNITVQQIRGAINGPDDLPGKGVGTIRNSVSAEYLRAHNARTVEFAQLGEMYQALLDKRVDAILLAAPPLRYYAAREGKGLVRLVGPEFSKGDAAFAFAEGSPLRRAVNAALLAVREDGTYQQIYNKWFASQ